MAEISGNFSSRVASEIHRYELTLSDYWRIIVKRRLVVFFTFVSVLLSTIFYTHIQTALYEASSMVRVGTGGRVFQFQGGYYLAQGADPMITYANMITGKEVLERVVIRLGFLSKDSKAEDLIEKSAEIREAVTATRVTETDMIQISVVYPDPKLAAAIANSTADAFIEVDFLQKTRQARNLRRFIEKQLEILSKKLKSVETQIQDFRQSGRAFGLAMGLEQRLSELEKDRNVLLKQFTEKHPDVLKFDDQIQGVRQQIRRLPAHELEFARFQRELEINDRAYRVMKEKYEAARLAEAEEVSDVTIIESATVPAHPISPRKDLNKMLGAFIGLILGLAFAFIHENLDTSIGTIDDVERTVRLPVIGIVPYFNPHEEDFPWWRIDRSIIQLFRNPRELPPDSAYLIMNQDTLSTLAEAYRILRTFVEFIMEKKTGQARTLIITSTGPQEGKTLTASNLAISMAQAGKKTLLIDADLRRPTIHRLFGLQRAPGLSEVLLGTVHYNQACKAMGDILVGDNSKWDHLTATKLLDRLEILTTGVHNPNPAELIASEEMKNLLNQLRSEYDYIILDTPPVLPVTDSRTLGLLADATFFVYRAGKTARRALTRAREELNLAGVNVKGIILNQATPEVTLTDSYYYQYYGEKKPKKGKPPSEIRSSKGVGVS